MAYVDGSHVSTLYVNSLISSLESYEFIIVILTIIVVVDLP